jgi:hypothetical protein
MTFEIPDDLNEHTSTHDAIRGKRICCVANSIKRYRRPHRGAGGAGQSAKIEQGVCWIEREIEKKR